MAIGTVCTVQSQTEDTDGPALAVVSPSFRPTPESIPPKQLVLRLKEPPNLPVNTQPLVSVQQSLSSYPGSHSALLARTLSTSSSGQLRSTPTTSPSRIRTSSIQSSIPSLSGKCHPVPPRNLPFQPERVQVTAHPESCICSHPSRHQAR